MSALTERPAQEYLQRIRHDAGINSREIAAMRVPLSESTIGRHERGETMILPHEAVAYADGYGSDDFLIPYCAQCPVGQRLRMPPGEWCLQGAAMRLSYLLKQMPDAIEEIERIVFDGIVDGEESPRLDRRLTFLKQVQASTDELIYAALRQQKKTAQQSG